MILNSARLENFRNIRYAQINFSDGMNIIRGDNAQGKTNILEALYIFARGRSHRTKKELELIKFGEHTANVNIEFSDAQRKKTLGIKYCDNEKKKMTYNGIGLNKTSEFIGIFRAVLFCPDHLSLIKESPAGRRMFLDVAISQLTPTYISLLKKYNNLLLQRNALLKYPNAESASNRILFESLAEQLSSVAAGITRLRYKYNEKLTLGVDGYFKEMTSGAERVKIVYEASGIKDPETLKSSKSLTETYYKLFTEHIPREAINKNTSYGPHKDDLNIILNGKSARLFCSQGQQRSLALALKLTEGDLSLEISGEYPVYLLDDILGELDENRQSFILSRLTDKQVIITSCAAGKTGGFEAGNIINVKNGEVT